MQLSFDFCGTLYDRVLVIQVSEGSCWLHLWQISFLLRLMLPLFVMFDGLCEEGKQPIHCKRPIMLQIGLFRWSVKSGAFHRSQESQKPFCFGCLLATFVDCLAVSPKWFCPLFGARMFWKIVYSLPIFMHTPVSVIEIQEIEKSGNCNNVRGPVSV